MADSIRPDVILAQRVRAGDRDALGELYDRHASSAMAVALRVVGDRERAEDIVHDAFVAVWQKIGRYDPARGEIRAWLLTIVRNRAVDGLRGERPTLIVDDLADALVGGGPNPTWEEAAERLSGAQLGAALRQLPDEQRTAVDLAYFKGHTYREVAEITGVPPGTASSRMRLALARLREILAETDAAPFWDERATALEGEPR